MGVKKDAGAQAESADYGNEGLAEYFADEADGAGEAGEGAEAGDSEAGEAGEGAEAVAAEEAGMAEEAGEEPDGKRLPDDVQAAIDKRIGKEVAKRKALEDELAELKARLDGGDKAGSEQAAGDEAVTLEALERREAELEGFLEWAEAHWDGYEGSGDDDPAYTATEIQAKHAQYTRELMRGIPRERARLEQSAAVERDVVAKVYPSLLDRSSDDYRIAETFLKRHPSLRNEPNIKVIIGDMLKGEELRRQAAEAGKAGKKAAGEKTGRRAAPPVPTGGAGGGAPLRPASPGGGEGKVNVKAWAEGGYDTQSLARLME